MSTAFDKLNDESNFDETGKIKPVEPEGESGTSAPPDPAAAAAASTSEDTAASQPSPDAQAATAGAGTAAEDKSGAAAAATKAAEQGKATPPAKEATDAGKPATDEESDEALRQRFSKPEDKGDEWQIRAYREAQKLQKRLGPIAEHVDRIASTERATRGLDFVATFAEIDTPIADAVTKMTALSPSRTQELHDHLYNFTLETYPDTVATDLVGEQATVKELQDGLKLLRSGAKAGQDAQPQSVGAAAPATTTTDVPKPEGMSDDDWEDFKVDFPAAYKTMQDQHARLQTAAKPAEPEPQVDPKVEELTQKVQSFEEKERTAAVEAAVKEIDAEGQRLHQEAFSVVEEGLRELGLEPDPANDDERTIRLKQETAKAIRDAVEPEVDGPDGPEGPMDWSLCTEEQKENRKLAVKIIDLLAKKDFVTARDYQDVMKARYDLAFQRVAPAKMELFNAAMVQQTTSTRNAGQQEHKRPEIVNGAAAAGDNASSKTPWLDPGFRQPGETAFAAMQRYTETHDTLPGR